MPSSFSLRGEHENILPKEACGNKIIILIGVMVVMVEDFEGAEAEEVLVEVAEDLAVEAQEDSFLKNYCFFYSWQRVYGSL